MPWRDVPGRYGKWETVYGLFRRWQRDGTWARIVAAVLFSVDTLEQIIGAAGVPAGGVARIYSLLIWLIGLAALFFLWRPDSTVFFKDQTGGR